MLAKAAAKLRATERLLHAGRDKFRAKSVRNNRKNTWTSACFEVVVETMEKSEAQRVSPPSELKTSRAGVRTMDENLKISFV